VKIRKVIGGISMTLVISSLAPLAPANATECTPEISTNGSLTVVAFKTVGTCTWTTPTATTTFRGLIVGGGGGGGAHYGGGGGGGGVIEFTSLVATNDEFTIVIGSGGGGSSSSGNPGTSGVNTTLSGSALALTALGGAGGGSGIVSSVANATSNGGSGGGGSGSGSGGLSSSATQSNQSQTPSLASISGAQFGFNGGTGRQSYYPGGGGGAGAAGSTNVGHGGAGRANDILGTSYFWAGGGGGAGEYSRAGDGGVGGGGGGAHNTSASRGSAGTGGISIGTAGSASGSAGASNTGGGGGGGGWNTSGGTGGSGIVILSYLRSSTPVEFTMRITSGSNIVYRTNSTIEAVVPRPGRVSFFQGGKPIAGCARKFTSGLSPNIVATCTWKPSTRGSINLSALYTPTNINFSIARVDNFPVVIGNRTTRR